MTRHTYVHKLKKKISVDGTDGTDLLDYLTRAFFFRCNYLGNIFSIPVIIFPETTSPD